MEEKKCGIKTLVSKFENIAHNESVLNKEKVEFEKLTRRNNEVQTISDENYNNVSKTFSFKLRRTVTNDIDFLTNDIKKADKELSSYKSESCCIIM